VTTNKEIANILYQIADILEMQDIPFKPNAYRRAAQTIEGYSQDIEEVYHSGKLKELPGIGEHIAEHIKEIIEHNGRSLHLEKLKKELPIKADELFAVEGLGPKRAMILYKKLKVTDLKSLETAALAGKISGLSGFGETTQAKILSGISFAKHAGDRKLLPEMMNLSEKVISHIKKIPGIEKITAAGSLRRRKCTVGDIDILVTTKKPAQTMNAFVTSPEVLRVVSSGTTRSTVISHGGTQCDLRVLNPTEWGSALNYFTGSKNHNIALRKIAISKKMKLSEYGLFSGKKLIARKTEEEIYNKLGLQYIEPELREDNGEIEAAQTGKLPHLIQHQDLLGDLHVHSSWSDGTATIIEMAQAARNNGLRYMALTDHTGILKIAGGLSPKQFEKQAKEVSSVRKKMNGFDILHGCESNIQEDGTPDLPDATLKKFDIVIASIHSGLNNNKKKATQRLIAALENPHIDIIGHPTGRIIGRRAGYEIDIDAVIKACKANDKALEIDSIPERTDLDASMVREVIKKGVRVTISSDSHATDNFKFLEYGVYNARRGWCEKKDVINTMSSKKVIEWAQRHE
jgi:DNA polymerase IV (family X)